jgi:hypothetical protein
MNNRAPIPCPALAAALSFTLAATALAREFHVSPRGDDAQNGSAATPLRTIAAAATLAQPGDVVTVHAGVYRERVNPPRGGESDTKRIVYQAAPGEAVTITGSEPVSGWEKVAGDTWKVTLSNRYFGNFNPYSDRIRGDWFDPHQRIHHTGCVYLDGDWLIEAKALDEVLKPAGKTPLWFATVDGDTGGYLLNVAWFKPSGGAKVPAGEPSWRYGSKPAPCSEGGTCSGFIMTGDLLRFDGVDFGSSSDRVEFRAAAAAGTGGIIELRLDDRDGELLGSCPVPATGDWQQWRSFNTSIKRTGGRRTVCLLFKHPAYDAGSTTIHAQFPGVNPNEAKVEINKRQTVFYPSKNFINYITVRGFTLCNAAANWAPPSSEQTGILGVNWSKGWIVESNTIAYSKCSGVALGKYGDGTDNTNDAGEADPYTACVRRALKNGWNKETIGSHVVRNNHIHHCEQTGVVGSMGCAFSSVIGNDIHDIHIRQLFGGAEMAGIKFHGAIDVTIANNHIYRCGEVAGIWLDWMAQGARVTGNFLHDNLSRDIFCEMQHGPLFIANNLLLSRPQSFLINSKGLAVVHNLIVGPIANTPYDGRNTPYHRPHSTEIAGLHDAPGGDHRFLNNLFVTACDLRAIDSCRLPCVARGNVFTKGTQPSKFDTDALAKPDFDPGLQLTRKDDGWYLAFAADPGWAAAPQRPLVTTELLGKAKVPSLAYDNPDGTPVRIDTDYLGRNRDATRPFPGPFEVTREGRQEIKVWPKP